MTPSHDRVRRPGRSERPSEIWTFVRMLTRAVPAPGLPDEISPDSADRA